MTSTIIDLKHVAQMAQEMAQEASGALELSESAFQHFFSSAVTRALARLEAGKLWRPKRRGSRR